MVYAPNVGQRAYDRIRAMLLAGHWPPGTQLEIASLAGVANVSSTPMREALQRLAAERLIDNVAGRGFFVPRPSEHELRALYRWWGLLARAAIDRGGGALPFAEPPPRLFLALARAAREPELLAALASAEDRLAPYAAAEAATLAGGEVPDFARLALRGDKAGLRRAVVARVGRCGAAVPAILETALQRASA